MKNHLPASVGVLAALFLLGSGCASTGDTRAPSPDVAATAEVVNPRTDVTIFGPDGMRANWSSIVQAAGEADAVFIGETHGHPVGLAAAAALWDDIISSGSDPALLLEFFERDEQVHLDDYLTGITDEAAFREASERTPGNYPDGHARMVESARKAGAPVIAANAPRRYVRLARQEGYGRLSSLHESQRRFYDIPERLPDGRYREEFFGLMSGGMAHGGDGAGLSEDMIEGMFRSQSLWDATMGRSVADATLRGSRPAVLVVGRFHSDFDGGTVQMFEQLRPDLSTLTVSMVTRESDILQEEDRGRADFVVYVGGSE